MDYKWEVTMHSLSEEQLEKIAKVLYEAAHTAWALTLELDNKDIFDELYTPQVNDYAFETSNPYLPRLYAIGKIVEITKLEGGSKIHLIERLDGKIQRWENARFVKVANEKTIELTRN